MQTRRVNGSAVRIIREALGVNLTDLAVRSGLDKGYVSRLENGARQPSPSKMRAMADALGVPLEAITYPVITITKQGSGDAA